MGIRGLRSFPVLREFLRAKVRGRRHGPVADIVWRLFVAFLATVATISLASLGEFFATAPEWISITLEPLSLLLMPGFAIALLAAGPHDLDPSIIVQVSIVFYLALFYWLLSWREWRRGHKAR